MNGDFARDRDECGGPRRGSGVAGGIIVLGLLVSTAMGCGLWTRHNSRYCQSPGDCTAPATCNMDNFTCETAIDGTGGANADAATGGTVGGATGGGGGATASGGSGGNGGGSGGGSGGSGGLGASGGTDGGIDAPRDMALPEIPTGCSPACTGALPICDSRTCRACTSPMDDPLCEAISRGNSPFCLPAVGCVACKDHSNCAAATAPICNPTNHACVACTVDQQCMDKAPTTQPQCLLGAGVVGAGSCVQCLSDARCGGATPICNAAHNCVPCTADAQCAGKGGACILTGAGMGTCVPCTANTHCTVATAPICDTTMHICAPCATNGECMTRNGIAQPVCITGTNAGAGSCVQCVAHSDCSGITPICNTGTHMCEACGTDQRCVAKNQAFPACITGTGAGAGSCVQCNTNATCTGTTPICTVATHVCAACANDTQCMMKDSLLPACITAAGAQLGSCTRCTTDAHCNIAAQPICIANACVRCTTDAQCAAKLTADPGVCMFHTDGHCATAAEVLYVRPAPGCSDSGTGLVTVPFCTPLAAIATVTTAKSTIVVRSGTVQVGSWTYGGTANLSVIGQGGPIIGPAGGIGIAISSGDVYVRGLSVFQMTDVGISVSPGSTIRLDRCIVTENVGGIVVNAAGFDISNSVFARNLAATTPFAFGGVYLSSAAGRPALFRNNTVYQNDGVGLVCAGAYPVKGLLVANNVVNQVSTCLPTASIVGNPIIPMFDPARPFHLTAASPCVNAGDMTDFPADDIDGDPRPLPSGGRSDCGADELGP